MRIEWTACGLAYDEDWWERDHDPVTNAWDGHLETHVAQDILRPYEPTASARFGPAAILVGGRDENGRTIIERIELVWPDAMPEPIVDPETGLTHVPLVEPRIGAIRILYSAHEPSRIGVSALCELRRAGAEPVDYLALFSDSKDLCVGSVDPERSELTLLASATDESGTLGLVPALVGEGLHLCEVTEHSRFGFVYEFPRLIYDRPVPVSAAKPRLALYDLDRDGSVDSFRTLTTDESFAPQ